METTCFMGNIANKNSRMEKEYQKKKFQNCFNEGGFL